MLPEFTEGLLYLLNTHQYSALFLLLLVQESGIPLLPPGYAVLMILGYQVAQGNSNVYMLLGVAALANFLGANVLYGIGRGAGHPLLIRYGRHLGMSGPRIARMEAWLNRFSIQAILAGRLIPGSRTATALAAGLFEVPYRVYAPVAALASVLWAGFYIAAGFFAGHRLANAEPVQFQFLPVTLGLLVIMAIVLAVATLAYRRRRLA